MIVVVTDTSPIRALAHLEVIDLLGRLFDRVLVQPVVARELESPPPRFNPVSLRELPFVEIRAPSDTSRVEQLLGELDEGEAQAIVLAVEVHAHRVLIDEIAARNVATRFGLSPLGALGVLLTAKEKGLIKRLKPLIDSLQNDLGFFIAAAIRDDCLRRANE